MQYTFQQKRRSAAYNLFKKGANVSVQVLLAIYENANEARQGFLTNFTDYPGFGVVRAMVGAGRQQKPKKETIRTSLHRLQKQGLIIKDPKQQVYCLTAEGKKFVSYIQNRYLILKNPWDKKFRIVVFDIPEQKKHWRAYLRDELRLMQFQQLQKSVYIGKHPLPESLIKEIEEAEMGRYIFIFTVNQIDRQKEVLKLLEK